jgi:hypothetical protein
MKTVNIILSSHLITVENILLLLLFIYLLFLLVHQCNIHFLYFIIRRHVSASYGHLQVLQLQKLVLLYAISLNMLGCQPCASHVLLLMECFASVCVLEYLSCFCDCHVVCLLLLTSNIIISHQSFKKYVAVRTAENLSDTFPHTIRRSFREGYVKGSEEQFALPNFIRPCIHVMNVLL